MTTLDDLPPEAHRQRYDALLAGARARATLPEVRPAPLDDDRVIAREPIPGGWYHTLRLRRGEALRLHNTEGTNGVAVLMWNAHEKTERLNVPDTLKVQWTARISTGRVLLSDMGRVLAAVIADDCGAHDGLVGGAAGPHGVRNTRDNFLRAAGKIGLDARDLPPCFTFFAPVSVGPDSRLHWREGVVRAGASVDLLAAMDLLVAISNCPHPLAPSAEAGAIEAITFRPGADAERIARDASPEAARAFARTSILHA